MFLQLFLDFSFTKKKTISFSYRKNLIESSLLISFLDLYNGNTVSRNQDGHFLYEIFTTASYNPPPPIHFPQLTPGE